VSIAYRLLLGAENSRESHRAGIFRILGLIKAGGDDYRLVAPACAKDLVSRLSVLRLRRRVTGHDGAVARPAAWAHAKEGAERICCCCLGIALSVVNHEQLRALGRRSRVRSEATYSRYTRAARECWLREELGPGRIEIDSIRGT
jgi:hypothetical protein